MTIVASNCQIIDSDGNIQVLSEDADSSDLPETRRNLLEHAQWVSVCVCVRACVRACVCMYVWLLIILHICRARSYALT